MAQAKEKKLRELVLPENSNDIELDFSVPVTEISFENTDDKRIKFGAKSTELLKKRDEEMLADPFILTSEFVQAAKQRRNELEALAAENRIAFEQRRALEIAEQRQKEREAAKEHLLERETSSQRQLRLEREQQKQSDREKIIKTIQNRERKEIEAIEVFFNLDKNKWSTKYDSIQELSKSPVKKIISARQFRSDRFGDKNAYRCHVCRYAVEESLSLFYIHEHIYAQKEDIINKIRSLRYEVERSSIDNEEKEKTLSLLQRVEYILTFKSYSDVASILSKLKLWLMRNRWIFSVASSPFIIKIIDLIEDMMKHT
jgi:hypothetical protein